MEKHLEMAVEVIHERIRLDQQRVSPDAAEVLRGIDARLFDPRFKAGSLSPTKKVRESFREVFRAVGYADPPQFRRAFKTWSGALAPDEYRTRVRHVASRVGPAPARFINWRYLEHVRGPAPKEALEWVSLRRERVLLRIPDSRGRSGTSASRLRPYCPGGATRGALRRSVPVGPHLQGRHDHRSRDRPPRSSCPHPGADGQELPG